MGICGNDPALRKTRYLRHEDGGKTDEFPTFHHFKFTTFERCLEKGQTDFPFNGWFFFMVISHGASRTKNHLKKQIQVNLGDFDSQAVKPLVFLRGIMRTSNGKDQKKSPASSNFDGRKSK